MSANPITTILTSPIILGGSSTNAYSTSLSISSTGAVEPGAAYPGDNAVYSDTVGVSLTNHGEIIGGAGGADSTNGGAGVYFNAAATLKNYAKIIGGAGYDAGGTGGVGVLMTGGTLDNYAFYIRGGAGEGTGDGGAGVDMTGGTFLDARNGTAGTVYGGKSFGSGYGGTGLIMDGGSATVGVKNGQAADYRIVGGNSYGSGTSGVGVQLAGGATLHNYASISAGNPQTGAGGVGVEMGADTKLFNDSGIDGGGSRDLVGGSGIVMQTGAQLYNYADIDSGGADGPGAGDGAGVDMLGDATIINGKNALNAGGNHYTGATLRGFGGGVSGGYGLEMLAGGTVKNYGGFIDGGPAIGGIGPHLAAVYAKGASSNAMAYVDNETDGRIYGGSAGNDPESGGAGVILGADAQLTNDFKIIAGFGEDKESGGNTYSGGIGVYINGSTAYNLNASGASIKGGAGYAGAVGGAGLKLTNGGSLVNRGTISGGADGSAAGVGAGVYTGTKLFNYDSIIGGTITTGGIAAAGVFLDGGTLYDYGSISGTQVSGQPVGDSVQFGSISGSKLVIGSVGGDFGTLQGDISGFRSGDTIDLLGVAPGSYTTSGSPTAGTFEIKTLDNGTLVFSGTYSSDFSFGAIDGGTGTSLQASCYRRGTRIRTAQGEVAIETLRIGDRVITHSGELKAIRWIGRRHHPRHSTAGNPDVLPVRISRGALGANVPYRDLWVSPEHALWLDGLLIPARALINGVSIAQEEHVAEVTYFHLEFDAHTILFAEGAPAESFVDDDSREMFDNAADYARRYPDRYREPARFCAPRVEEGWALEAVRQRLGQGVQNSSRSCAMTTGPA